MGSDIGTDPRPSQAYNPAAAAITGGSATGLTVDGVTPAQMDILANGAKATIAVTMNAFGTWADGQTIVLPTIGSHTLKVTTTGDIDIVGLGEAAAKAAVAAYLTAHASATCDVAIVGTSSTMTVTAKTYGATLNDSVISGTMLAARGTMANGSNPLTAAQMAALSALDTNGEDYLSSGVWPTIVANAATISPGPYGPGRYTIPATLALGAGATVSIDKAGSPTTHMQILIACRALALGFTLTIANAAAGGNGGNIVVIPASLAHPIFIPIIFNGVDWIGPNFGGPVLEGVA
jgi:hypothetical protein